MTADPQARHIPTPSDGMQALRSHAVDCAWRAAAALGPFQDFDAMLALLGDSRFVRYPVQVRFDAGALQGGELAWVERRGTTASEGFTLWIHPRFQGRDADLLCIAAYQLVVVNYGDIATHEEAELFGATLLNMTQDTLYDRLCALADELAPTRGCGSRCGCG